MPRSLPTTGGHNEPDNESILMALTACSLLCDEIPRRRSAHMPMPAPATPMPATFNRSPTKVNPRSSSHDGAVS